MTALIVVAMIVTAAISFYRAVSGYRSGKATLRGSYGPVLDADREDDPVGFSTAVWVNAAVGIFALSVAAWAAFHSGAWGSGL